MLIAISESRRPRRNSVRYPVNAGFNVLNRGRVIYFPAWGRQKDFFRQFGAIPEYAGI
jgi:hypothetical protein